MFCLHSKLRLALRLVGPVLVDDNELVVRRFVGLLLLLRRLLGIVDVHWLIGRSVRKLRQNLSGRFCASLVFWLFLSIVVETLFRVKIDFGRRRKESAVLLLVLAKIRVQLTYGMFLK